MATLSNLQSLQTYTVLLFPYSCEQSDPFTTDNLVGQYLLLCIAGDGEIFWVMGLFVIHPAPPTSRCHLLVLIAELSDKYLAVPSLVLQNIPIILNY